MDPSAPGWYPDPYGRHERRYWSGIRWSRHVDDGGRRTEDPLDTGPVATMPIDRPPEHWPEQPSAISANGPRAQRRLTGPQPTVDGAARHLDRGGRPGDSGGRAFADHTTGEHWPATRVASHRAPGGPRRSAGPEWEFGAEAPRRRFTEERSRRPYALIAGALAVLLVAAGAFVLLKRGGSGGTADETSDSDPVHAAVLTAMDHKAAGSLSSKQTRCMTDAVIDTAGKDRLIEQGVIKGADPVLALDPTNKDTVIKNAFDCLDDKALVAFMAATWTDQNSGKKVTIGPCVFKGWLLKLGRARMVYLYSSFATVDPPSLDKTLNANEFTLATRVLNKCGPSGSSTSAAP